MAFFDTQNPGIGGLDEITDAEALFLQNVASLSYAQGDILYYDGSNLNRLAAGTNGQFLKTQGAGANPIWAAIAAGGDVTKVGTPVNNQIGVWTGDGTLEGDAALTFDTTTDILSSGGLLLSGLTASEIVGTDASKNLVSLAVATYPSLTELTYVKGVTSAIQTQLGTKAPTTAPTFATSITGSYLTASEILITDVSKNIVSAPVATYPSLTELTYVKGVTSAIQTQLGTKAPTASPTFTGTVTLPVGLTGVIRTDTGVVSVDSDVTDIVSAASTSVAGKVELATTSEIDTGTDSTRAMPVDQFVASNRNVRYLDFYLIDSAADLTVGTGKGGNFECPFTGTITAVGAYVNTAGTTNASVIDINKAGVTIMTTNKCSIDSGETSTRTAATAPTLTTTAITAGDLLSFDIDSLSTTVPKGLHVRMEIRLT